MVDEIDKAVISTLFQLHAESNIDPICIFNLILTLIQRVISDIVSTFSECNFVRWDVYTKRFTKTHTIAISIISINAWVIYS